MTPMIPRKKRIGWTLCISADSCCRLAYAEMRLIIARLAWQFDIEILDKSADWTDQKVYWSWKKPALLVQLSQRISVKSRQDTL